MSLYRAIYHYYPLSRYSTTVPKPISIIVKNGSVVLEGAVASDEERNAASSRVVQVKGVSGVTNNLRVQSKSARESH